MPANQTAEARHYQTLPTNCADPTNCAEGLDASDPRLTTMAASENCVAPVGEEVSGQVSSRKARGEGPLMLAQAILWGADAA